jgi:hypothetical protein
VANAAAERLRQQRGREGAALADGLRCALAEDGARAEADDRHHRRERGDDPDRVEHGLARRVGVGDGEEARQDVRQPGGADEDRQAGRDHQDRRRQEGARAEDRVAVRMVLGRRVEHLARAEVELGQHRERDDRAGDHQHHGLDDLHPGRGQHAAEDDVDDHEDAADEHGEREADAGQGLDHGARADQLGDEVDAADQQRVDRGRDPHRARLQAEGQHVGDGELARVAHPLGEQVEHRQERQAGAEADDPAVEAVQVHQAGVAEERRGAEVVAGGRDAVGAAGDAAARGVELGGAARALGRPAGDHERDGEDAGEDADGQRVELACGREQPHRAASSTTRCAIRSHSGARRA